VTALEMQIDAIGERCEMPKDFVVPGQGPTSAALDVARTVVRRAERTVASMAPLDEAEPGSGPQDAGDATEGEHPGGQPSHVGPYLNRLSDLLWTMARWQEGEVHLSARERPRRGGAV